MMFSRCVPGALVVAVATSSSFAHDHRHVPKDFPTIQAAIDGSHDTDIIEIDPGTYTGPGFHTLDFRGKNLLIVGVGGAEAVTINLTGKDGPAQFVDMPPAEGLRTSVLIGITFINGRADEGGAIRVRGGSLIIDSCRFMECEADAGGAVCNTGGEVTILNSAFDHNTALAGGAVSTLAGVTTINRSRFTTNHAVQVGGAIETSAGAMVVCNSLILNNISVDGGGALAARGGQSSVVNCTLYGNGAAGPGGAVLTLGGDASVVGSILRNNFGAGEAELAGAVAVTHSNVRGGAAGAGNIDADPGFIDPAADNFRLAPGSPCVDAGDAAALPASFIRDLDGNPRVLDGDLSGDRQVDMGAYELGVACPADWNGAGGLNTQDFFDFLADFFAGDADFNADNATNSQDFFDFLAAFFAGCDD